MNDYNFFKVLKLERKETIHSAMIAAIVGHDEKCWTTFFNMLEEKGKAKGFNIKALRDSIIFDDNINHKWIDTENVLEKLNKKERDDDWGRADIWIGTNKGKEGERYRLIIENKIDAGFQYRQLRGYYRYLIEEPRKLAGLFVLCVNDNMAFREKAKVAADFYKDESRKDDKTQYAIITYADIKEWLEKVIDNDTKDTKFNSVVKDYLSIVKNLIKEKEGENKTINDNYEYMQITVFDENGEGWDYPVDYLMENAVSHLSKAEQSEYLTDIIHDIEHYRDSL